MNCSFRYTLQLLGLLTLAGLLTCSVYAQKPSENESELISVLKGDSPAAEKAIACKKLAVYGSSEAVSELAKLLPNEQLSSWARIALEAIPGPAADEALLKSLDVLKGLQLVGTINSIGVRRDPSAVDSLKKKLQDSDEQVASAAAVALGKIGTSAASDVLSKSLDLANAKVRSSVAEGLVLCAERAAPDEAIELYDLVRKAKVSKPRILEATRGAILARKQAGIPLLLEQLRSSDKGLFQIGLSTARELAGKEVDAALASELEKAVPEKAALIIQAMADRTDTVDMKAVLKAAQSGSKVVRASAANALGRVGDASCFATLLESASDEDEELSGVAKLALAQIADPRVNTEMLERLPKSDGKSLRVLLDVIGQRRLESTKEIVKHTRHSDKAIRASALMALGNTVSMQQLNLLIDYLVSPKDPEDLEVAQKALKTAATRMPDRDECSTALAAAMDKASMATKLSLLDVIAAVAGKKSLETLADAAKSSDLQLKDAGSRLLGDWMTIDGAPVLLELATTGPNDKFQVRAMRGYIKMARQFNMNESQRISMTTKAWEASKQLAEKKLVVEVMRRYPSIGMLELAVKASGNPETKEEATAAALEIAKKLPNKKEEANAILKKAGIKIPDA